MTAAIAAGKTVALTNERVRAGELGAKLAALGGEIKRLSLDCFDTILVRDVAEPLDVFFDLARSEPFARLGFEAKLRIEAESHARSLNKLTRDSAEVTLPDIYRAAFPALTDAMASELARAELGAEQRACSAFPPVVDLMLAARERGLPIVIVSDTYFSEAELRELLAACVPAAALAAVDRIFCSSEHGLSKGAGLFKVVLQRLGVPARSLLHVGDHPLSDRSAAHAQGLHALELVRHSPAIESACRTQSLALGLVAPEVRRERSSPQPYAALFAQADGLETPAAELGYVGLGPLLYAFGRFLQRSFAELEAQGARPKPVFLLRDAFLPERVCAELAGGAVGPLVSLSRFAAYAASLRTREDVERYLARSAGSGRFEAMSEQLLIPPDVAERLVKAAERAREPVLEFVRRVLDRSVLASIFARSAAYRARLYRYLERRVKLERGDTLVLVDLGYEGTAQRELGPVLADELGVGITGRYLLAARVPGWDETRRGLIEPSWCDDRVTAALVPHIALLEDVCTSDDASVVDYTEAGEPVFDQKLIAPEQYERVKAIQAETLRFVRDAEAFFARTGKRPEPDVERLAALAALTRLLFFPGEGELACLEGFRLDMNLRTLDAFELFNHERGLEVLRRKGAFFRQPGLKTLRTNYPLELRGAGIELSLALFAQRRFTLNLGLDDVTLRREKLSLLLVGARGSGVTTAEARATHDGYFSLVVPMSRDTKVGVLFGQNYAYVQLHSIELLPTNALSARDGEELALDVSSSATADGMRDAGGGLFECLSESAFLLIAPENQPAANSAIACRIVFRPIVRRAPQAAE
jgi:FMN phosphatase YigB (HAD superfamily)